MSQLGVETLPRRLETKQVRLKESRVLEEVHHHVHTIAPFVPPVVSVAPTTPMQDDGLRQDMRQVVDLMKNLSLNLWAMLRVMGGSLISLMVTMDRVEVEEVQIMEEVGRKNPLATIVVSLDILAHSVSSTCASTKPFK